MLLDPEDALDREIYGSEYEAQCLGIDTEVAEITAAFFEVAGEEAPFCEPGSSFKQCSCSHLVEGMHCSVLANSVQACTWTGEDANGLRTWP